MGEELDLTGPVSCALAEMQLMSDEMIMDKGNFNCQ